MALSFASPAWLAALLLLPLLRWLHRFREHGRPFPVAALFLWSAAARDDTAGQLAERPDPVWWLRAALAALLAVALAGPRWQATQPAALTLWIDDSVSMHARDDLGAARLERGWQAALAQLAALDATAVTLRSLGRPGKAEVFPANALPPALPQGWLVPAPAEPEPPLPLQMDRTREHWLLSDGNSAAIADWVQQAPLSRVLAVGTSASNAGISNLSLRRFADDSSLAEVLITVRNAGAATDERVIDLFYGPRRVLSQTLSLAPGQDLSLHRRIAADEPGALRARLAPADALVADDELVLAAADIDRRTVSVSGDCGPYLPAALAAHPWLLLSPVDAPPDLRVHCSPAADAATGTEEEAAIFVVQDIPASPVSGTRRWARSAEELRELALPGTLQRRGAVSEGDGWQGLLSAGDIPLIALAPDNRRLHVALDLADPRLAGQPVYPLLILGLVDTVLGRDLRGGALAAERPLQQIDIAPRPLPEANLREPRATVRNYRDLSPVLIGCALLLLCVDLWRVVRRYRRQARAVTHWAARHAR